MIDGLPVLRIVAPNHIQFVAYGIRITREQLLLARIPEPRHMRLAHQHVSLFFVALDYFCGRDVHCGVHSEVAFRMPVDPPSLDVSTLAFQRSLDDVIDKTPMT